MEEIINELENHIDPDRPLSFEDWCKEFKVGTRATPVDSEADVEIKKMKIINAQKYCPVNAHYKTQAIFIK